METKRCKKCGVEKPLETGFYRATGTRDGHRGECIACSKIDRRRWYDANKDKAIDAARRWQERNPERTAAYREEYRNRPERKRAMRDRYYRVTFGLSADEVDEMIAAQGGCCAICSGQPERLGAWHVDHEHETGRIRGILCSRCNHAIGLLQEDPGLLERAAAYLRAG